MLYTSVVVRTGPAREGGRQPNACDPYWGCGNNRKEHEIDYHIISEFIRFHLRKRRYITGGDRGLAVEFNEFMLVHEFAFGGGGGEGI